MTRFNGIMVTSRGIVYGAREAHNLAGWVRLPVPQQSLSEKDTGIQIWINR